MPEDEQCANPLLLSWVKEWLDVAKERNSRGVTVYKHAYDSLKACPISFEHPSQLQQLRGFGPKLCDRLTEKLQKHCQENNLPAPKKPARHAATTGQAAEGDAPVPAKKPRKKKPYVPTYRSGAYAIILALATMDENEAGANGLTKAQVIEIAQPLCDSSFTAPPDPTSFYTAWNSIKTLMNKDLVYERGRPLRRYGLTDEGWEVTKRIQAATNSAVVSGVDQGQTTSTRRPAGNKSFCLLNDDDDGDDEDLVCLGDDATPRSHVPVPPATTAQPNKLNDFIPDGPISTEDDAFFGNVQPIQIPPGSFSVRLLLDTREVRAVHDRDYMQDELSKLGAKPIMRSLELGDACWVAKCHDPDLLSRLGAEGDEIVLDYIVERKRLDDLIGSIKDGRFHEQKFRLKRSGLRNVIYIIEEISLDTNHYQKYDEAVRSAIASTQVVNGYFVKRTHMMDETVRYLARMTKLLKEMYESKPVHVIPSNALTTQNYLPLLEQLRARFTDTTGIYVTYSAFGSLASKSDLMTLRDVFLKMLMTTKGVTGERAVEIQKRWKTPRLFIQAFERCGTGDVGERKRKAMVAEELAHVAAPRKRVNKILSERIAGVWGAKEAAL